MEPILTRRFATPAGELILGGFRGEVVLCDWAAGKRRAANVRRVQTTLGAAFEEGDSALLRRLGEELEEYFDGTRRGFDLPLRYTGTTFESRVWDELRRIPFGETIPYGELARRTGNTAATAGTSRKSIFTRPPAVAARRASRSKARSMSGRSPEWTSPGSAIRFHAKKSVPDDTPGPWDPPAMKQSKRPVDT